MPFSQKHVVLMKTYLLTRHGYLCDGQHGYLWDGQTCYLQCVQITKVSGIHGIWPPQNGIWNGQLPHQSASVCHSCSISVQDLDWHIQQFIRVKVVMSLKVQCSRFSGVLAALRLCHDLIVNGTCEKFTNIWIGVLNKIWKTGFRF